MNMKGFVISNKLCGIIKPLLPHSSPFWNLINYNVNETQWVIRLHKTLFYQSNFFIKVWWYPFWTMKITIDCISFIAFWSFGGPWWRKFCVFPINVELISAIDVYEFGVQTLTRVYFYGKLNVWMIIV